MSVITNVEDRDIQDVKLDKNLLEEKTIIGSFVKNTGMVQLINVSKKYNLLDKTEISIGNHGTWYVNSVEPDLGNVTIKLNLYNLAYRFDKEYSDGFIFPASLKSWATWIGEQVGVPLGNENFPNADFILNERPYFGDKPSYRDAIRLIARYAGSYIKIGNDNKYYITWFNDNVTEIEDWFEATDENETEPVNIVILGKGDVGDNIKYPETEPENPIELRIDSEFLNVSREQLIIPIYNQVNGFKYVPCTLQVPGLVNFEVGSTIQFLDLDYNLINTYVMNHRIEFQGGDFFDEESWISFLETIQLDETSTNFKYAKSIQEQVTTAQRDVDKINGVIDDVVSQVDGQNKKITKVEQDVDSISQTVSNSLNFEKEVIGKTQVYIEDALPTKIKQFELRGYSRPQLSTYPGLNYPGISYPSGLVENKIDQLIITVDKQPKSNPSSSKKPYVLNIGEPLRSLNNIYDKLTIDIDSKVTITRRLKIENDKIVQLSNPIVTTIEDCNIILFEGDNYIYVNDPNYQMQVDYLFNNELNKQFATKTELTTSIQQTDSTIQLLAEKKVDDDKIIATINLTTQTDDGGSEIKLKADKLGLEGYTTINGAFSVDLSGNMKANGATMNDVLITGGDITLEDTGDDSNPTIEIYDKNSVTLGTLNVGDNLNDKILNMNFLTNGDIMGSSQPSLQWNNLITTDKWNYIQHFYTSTNNTEEFLCINYKGKTNYLYINYGRNIETNLTTYQLPSDFGKITSIGSINGIYNYIKIGSIRKKTTKLKSSGVEIIDVDNNVNTIYGSNGMYVKDQFGTKSFGANGILYMTSYGPDYSQFSVDNRTLMYVARGLKSHMLMDCGYPNPNDDYFEIQLNQTRQLLLNSNGLTCVTLTQTSLESMKKNIKKFTNALELVKNSDIYTYNFKHEDDEDKPHIGLVIGENYNTPNELVSKSGEGIDTYSMISVLWKAVQEQQTIIEKLGDRIKKLEEMIE